MRQTAALVNAVYDYQTPFDVSLSGRYPESTFTIYDVYSLVRLDLLIIIVPIKWARLIPRNRWMISGITLRST